MPFFSVIIPTYNRARLVGLAIDSVLAQEFQDFELVVVDDGSTDNTAEVLADYARRYAGRITILAQENKGPGAARNLAMRQAGGRYLALLDSDDVWFPWTLGSYREAIDRATVANGDSENNGPSILFGSALHFHDAAELKAIPRAPMQCDLFENYIDTCRPDAGDDGFVRGTCTAVFRADLWRASGGFFERTMYCEDLDLLFRMGTSHGFVYVRSPVQIGLRAHNASSIGNLTRTYDGTAYLIQQEKAGRYPGGAALSSNRRWALCHHIRLVTAVCMDRRELRRGLSLYFKSFFWQLRERRWRYLMGLPLTPLVPRLNPVRGYKRS